MSDYLGKHRQIENYCPDCADAYMVLSIHCLQVPGWPFTSKSI